MDTNFSSIHRLAKIATDSMESLNIKIKSVDWNKVWQSDYPKTERAKQEVESLQSPEAKESLKEIFSEQSLAFSQLGEVF